jgi:hypothetical protein
MRPDNIGPTIRIVGLCLLVGLALVLAGVILNL